MTSQALQKAQERIKELREAGEMAPQEHNLIKKALADPKSRKKAMDAKCFECYGGTARELPDPGYKDLIGTCPATDCPIWQFRPYQRRKPCQEVWKRK